MAFNSDKFNLKNWKLTLPVDAQGLTLGVAVEVKNLIGYESTYFFDAPDGAMVFKAMAEGATTSGSSYARCELREMKGLEKAAWKLSEGGTMSATLKVESVPKYADGRGGRVIVGQIHGADHELVRLYWQDNTLFFKNDRSGADDKEHEFRFKDAAGKEPNVVLGEKFSYLIDARGDVLTVEIFADGGRYTSITKINSIWQTDTFYFKAGVYLGVNETQGAGLGQTSFYALDFGHISGAGLGGLPATLPPAAPVTADKPVTRKELAAILVKMAKELEALP